MIQVIDNWFPNPEEEAQKALTSNYLSYMIGSLTFPSIAVHDCNWSEKRASEELGITLVPSMPLFYRQYKTIDLQPTFIHSDLYEGTYTLIVFLNKDNNHNGLAFWEHASGLRSANKLNYRRYEEEAKDEGKWTPYQVVPAAFNRAVLFSAPLFHSRWPKQGWDVGDAEPRTIKVGFFNPVA